MYHENPRQIYLFNTQRTFKIDQRDMSSKSTSVELRQKDML